MTGTKNSNKELIFKYRDVLVCLYLVLVTIAVYWQVYGYDFVGLDDGLYYYENRYTQAGLTLESIKWSFTNTVSGMWIPMTWLSYMVGSNLYGNSPGWHHITNVFLHVANTLLLYYLFRRMTGGFWASVVVVTLFALHPIHVESVAWITERKDVLSMFFILLTIIAYHRYVSQPLVRKYILILIFFAFGIMAKPMIITLPFILMLLDYWPMNRFKLQEVNSQNTDNKNLSLFYLIKVLAVFRVLTIQYSNRKLQIKWIMKWK